MGWSTRWTVHGLRDRFHTLQTADLCRSKPDPEMVLRAMAETGMEAAATVVIGDTSFDMEMARSAGATAIGVAWGYHETAELTQCRRPCDHPPARRPPGGIAAADAGSIE